SNIDVSKDESIGHISIDKSPRLHAMAVNKVVAVARRGGGAVQIAAPTNAQSIPPSSHPASSPANLSATKPEPGTAPAPPTRSEPLPPVARVPAATRTDSGAANPATRTPAAGPQAAPANASTAVPLEYQRLSR